MIAELWRHILSALRVYVPAAAALFVVFLVAREYDVAFLELTRDPFAGQASSIPVYTSILSNIGIIGWCFTIAIQFFSAWALRRHEPDSQRARFLFWSGLITSVLMLDDFLMLHERLNHSVETMVFGAYGLWVAIGLMRFRHVIFSTNYLLLGSALVFFGLSMVLDNIFSRLSIEIPYRTVLEDAFKIIGIFGWAYYFISFAMGSLRARLYRGTA